MPISTALWLVGLCLLTGTIGFALGGPVLAAGVVGFFVFATGLGLDLLEGDEN